jgi:trigger factor
MKIDGFRKGKIPVAVVKQRYGGKLVEDAHGELLRAVMADAMTELELTNDSLVGEPAITTWDEQENGDIKAEMKIFSKPTVELGDYKSLIPEVKEIEIADEDIDAEVKKLADGTAPTESISEDRAVQSGDFVVIDFEGFVDDVAFDGGKAEAYTLEIGSGSFIPGFEDQIIGMNKTESKDINVTFPAEYQSAELAGKDSVFKVTLHDIQVKGEPVIDDEIAKQALRKDDATLDELKDAIKNQLLMGKKREYYHDELKAGFMETLLENISIDAPSSVVEQEVSNAINTKVRVMSEEEVEALKNDQAKVEEMADEARPEAENSVKATFLIDALAKAENIEVTDEEVTQTLYYEALQMGQDPMAMIKQYEENGYLAAIKMSMVEDKVLFSLFDEKLGA